jgi:hypothetical protein
LISISKHLVMILPSFFLINRVTFLFFLFTSMILSLQTIILVKSINALLNCIITFFNRDLGDIHYFLGIEATTNNTRLCLTQTKYLTDLLTRSNMLHCKPCLSLMASGTILTLAGSRPCSNPHLYCSVVGALQYAMLTIPDIAYSVNKISQYMHNPLKITRVSSSGFSVISLAP